MDEAYRKGRGVNNCRGFYPKTQRMGEKTIWSLEKSEKSHVRLHRPATRRNHEIALS